MSGNGAGAGIDRRALALWVLALLAVGLGIWLGANLYAAWSALPAPSG